jgi:prolipoprotein diacylglyceryltransferase
VSTTPYMIIFGVICLIGLVATIWVGRNPVEANYENTTKKRVKNLTFIYLITIILFSFIAMYFIFSK